MSSGVMHSPEAAGAAFAKSYCTTLPSFTSWKVRHPHHKHILVMRAVPEANFCSAIARYHRHRQESHKNLTHHAAWGTRSLLVSGLGQGLQQIRQWFASVKLV